MARRLMQFGPFNGIHRSLSQDAMPPNTLRAAFNCRQGEYGDAQKRRGSQKIHDTILTEEFAGLYGWDSRGFGAASSRLVYVSGVPSGNVYVLDYPNDTDFTSLGSIGVDNELVSFAEWDTGSERLLLLTRHNNSTRIYKTDGTTLTQLTDSPLQSAFLEVYKSRLWCAKPSAFAPLVSASAVNDPEEWSVLNGAILDIPIGDADSTGITGIKAVGESLLIFKRNSIARLHGTDPEGINVDADTEGISRNVGCISFRTIVRFEQRVFFLSEAGPYIADEGGIEYIGKPIEYWMRRLFLSQPDVMTHAAHLRSRREIHLWVTPGPRVDIDGRYGSQYTSTWGTYAVRPIFGFIWNYETNQWWGPQVIAGSNLPDVKNFVMGSASFQRNSSTQLVVENDSIVLAFQDRLASDTDTWIVDFDPQNVFTDLADRATGANGSTYTPVIELPELLYGDPTRLKLFNPSQYLSADIDVTAQDTDAIQVRTYSEVSPESTLDITVPTLDTPDWVGEFRDRVFRFSPSLRGKRPVMQIIFNNDGYASLKSVSLTAELGRRVI